MYDIKIVGGTIMDGTGTPGYRGDVGIKGGKVVALGRVSERGHKEIDASGKVVCPGFVDIHTHYDAQVLWDGMLSVSPWHGVTTAVIGNCGFGVAPTRPDHRNYIMRTLEKVEGMSFAVLNSGMGADWQFETFSEYMDAIEERGTAINVAVLAGHTPMRMYVMGLDSLKRSATESELLEMQNLLREAMAAGAIGFATSRVPLHFAFDGYPVPSRLANLDEVDRMMAAMSESGTGILQAAAGPDFTVREMAALSKKYERPITWAALLASPGASPPPKAVLEAVAEAHADGAKVWPQVSCRPLQFDFTFRDPYPFGALAIFGPLRTADDAQKKSIFADSNWRAQLRSTSGPGHNFLTGWINRTVVSANPSDTKTEGLPITVAARQANKDPIDFVLDSSIASDLNARFRLDAVNFDETEVAELLQHADKNAVIGLSDAGAHADQLCDACFSTHLLGHWVRDRKLMNLERAVHILTKHPADVFGIADRGLLALGRAADVVVFDPLTVSAGSLRRVHDLPARGERLVSDALGVEVVIVNGQVLRESGTDALTPTQKLPGRLLRNGKYNAQLKTN